jgi:maltose-binding protein MalE
MRPDERAVLERQIKRYMVRHPGVEVQAVYKETETLRSGYVIASIASQGPELIHGPCDPIGIYEATKTIRPLEDCFTPEELSSFDSSGLLYYEGHLYQVADKIGNHLALVYNKKYITTPPQTDEELISMGQAIQERYGYKNGRPVVYALAWNYTEPFFFIPFFTGFGGWVFAADGRTPTLNSPAMIEGLKFIKQLRDVYKIVPNESDYEIADALFKDGKAAMIINGDWSWAGYKQKGLDIGVAILPKIVRTGLWCSPIASLKGYSINSNVRKEKLPLVLDVMKYLVSEECQIEIFRELNTAPTLKILYSHPEITSNEILTNSLLQIKHGKPMPVVPEMRAVWDAMRPGYQDVMGGARSPEDAAKLMQTTVEKKIRDMKE